MAKRPSCDNPDQVHVGFDKTGGTVPSPSGSGVRLEVWKCQCGKKTHHVLPGKAKRDW